MAAATKNADGHTFKELYDAAANKQTKRVRLVTTETTPSDDREPAGGGETSEPKFIVQTYELSAPYDLANATLGERHVCDPEQGGDEMYFPPDGHSLFVAGYGKHPPSIFRFDLLEPWRIASLGGGTASQVFSVAETFSIVTSFHFGYSGDRMFVMGYEQTDTARDNDKTRKANLSIDPIPKRPEPPHVHCNQKWDLLHFLLIGMAALWTIFVVGTLAILMGFTP
jgi:hypothetical protein